MKYALFSLCILLASCSSSLYEEASKEWQQAKEHDYLKDFREILNLEEISPTPEEQMAQREQELCMHEDAHEREITANGVNDAVNYRYCTLSPSLGNQYPQRLDGR